MCEFNSYQGKVCVTKGDIFDISLEMQAGSTGYSWALTSMPKCLMLLDVSVTTSSSQIVGAKCSQIFKFAAMDDPKPCIVEFGLCRPWEPLDIVQKKSFVVEGCGQYCLENDLRNTLGADKYLAAECLNPNRTSEEMPAIPYGVLIAVAEDKENCILKYGAPTGVASSPEDCIVKYGVPANVIHDDNNCILKYGTPFGFAVNPENCTLKYGIPVNIAESSTNCTVKYGTPFGSAENEDACILKYGAPVNPKFELCSELINNGPGDVRLMYGINPQNMLKQQLNSKVMPLYKHNASENIVIVYNVPEPKYGVPCNTALARTGISPIKVVEDTNNCVLKYGIPTGLATDPKDCILKYGAPAPKDK